MTFIIYNIEADQIEWVEALPSGDAVLHTTDGEIWRPRGVDFKLAFEILDVLPEMDLSIQ